MELCIMFPISNLMFKHSQRDERLSPCPHKNKKQEKTQLSLRLTSQSATKITVDQSGALSHFLLIGHKLLLISLEKEVRNERGSSSLPGCNPSLGKVKFLHHSPGTAV